MKGRGAGYASLAKEWVAGSLARRLELPVPRFAILTVPAALFGRDRPDWLSALGEGPVFGSKAVEGSDEIAIDDLDLVPDDLKRDIAAFDWWVLNGDRTLSESGGNPNILWIAPGDGPYIIDHNLAFDRSVTLASLERQHVFGPALSEVVETTELSRSLTELLAACFADWDDIWHEMPERWLFADDRLTVRTGFAKTDAERVLRRVETDELWTRA